jgi:sialidase-1
MCLKSVRRGVRVRAALGLAVAVMAATAGWPAPARSEEEIRRTVVFESGVGGYHTYRIPAIVAAANGDLVAFCEGRRQRRGDAGDIDVLCRRSPDGGATWGAVEVVWDEGANSCGNPCPVVDRSTGVFHLLLTNNLGGDREAEIIAGTSQGTRTVWVAASSDHGATWSQPREITAACKAPTWTWYATGPGAGIQLQRGEHAGRLVIPCDHIEADTKRYYSHVIFSDDHGVTWTLGGSTPDDQVNECEVVELADGRLLLNMRNYDPAAKARQIAVSNDGGQTWSGQRHDPTLVEPRCQASVRRVRWPTEDRPGLIVFANPASAERRERLTLRGSLDDGATWPLAMVLEPRASAYSCLVALADGEVGCLYERGEYEEIVFARVEVWGEEAEKMTER